MRTYADTVRLHEVLADDEFSNMKTESACERFLRLSSLKIDEVTFNRIKGVGFENLTPFQRECVRDACCYQAYKISVDGMDNDEVQSYSVGDISISTKINDSEAEKNGLCAEAYLLLKQSGLMQRVI